jgi:small subunit ribosomal protein S5e
MAEQKVQEERVEKEEKVQFANAPKLFGRWDYSEVSVNDLCYKDYIAVATTKS